MNRGVARAGSGTRQVGAESVLEEICKPLSEREKSASWVGIRHGDIETTTRIPIRIPYVRLTLIPAGLLQCSVFPSRAIKRRFPGAASSALIGRKLGTVKPLPATTKAAGSVTYADGPRNHDLCSGELLNLHLQLTY